MELLEAADRAVFLFLNRTLSSPAGDLLWPVITDYDKLLPVRILLGGVWIWLLVRAGVKGRTAALLLVPLLAAGDQLSSSVLKEAVGRARPCHEVNGVPHVEEVRLLVGCGSGKSFPSSHAVNNFAAAALFAYYYRRWRWWFFGWAFLVAASRVAVGVHYPSDVLGGALIGILLAAAFLWLARAIGRARQGLRGCGSMRGSA
ncbi:MAG: phosphatase PAP2 family protein [Bacteroidota bacterium]